VAGVALAGKGAGFEPVKEDVAVGVAENFDSAKGSLFLDGEQARVVVFGFKVAFNNQRFALGEEVGSNQIEGVVSQAANGLRPLPVFNAKTIKSKLFEHIFTKVGQAEMGGEFLGQGGFAGAG